VAADLYPSRPAGLSEASESAPANVPAVADQVIIVGGGLTGLVAARELHRRGMRIVVLEASDHLGCRVATVTFADGAVAEGGMEEFWQTSPAYPMLGELGLPVIEQAALSSVVLGGRLHHYHAAGTAAYGAALDGGAGCAGFSAWNDLVTTVLDELAVAQRTGHESAHLAALRRTATDKFNVSQALTLDQIQALTLSEIEQRLIPAREAVPSFVP